MRGSTVNASPDTEGIKDKPLHVAGVCCQLLHTVEWGRKGTGEVQRCWPQAVHCIAIHM